MTRRLITAGIVTVLTIASMINGQTVTAPEITFTKDVAPIFVAHCVYCHRPGEIAPFSMLTFAEVRPWARSIKQQVLVRRMPPWFADPNHGDFINAKRLNDSEIQTIVRWVDGGAREGNPSDMPAPPPSNHDWQIGSPDLIVSMAEPYRIPATGNVPSVTLPTNYVFPEDVWVQAIEVRPGNRRVVHQALALLGSAGAANSLHLYAPGLEATVFKEGYGRFIPKDTRIHLQMHYNVIGQEALDQTQVGFKFARRTVHTEVRTGIADNGAAKAPAPLLHGPETTFPLSVNARVYAIRLHMQARGSDAKATMALPDGSRTVLIAVTDWIDYWQYTYIFKKPVDVPRGAVIEYTANYDAAPQTLQKTHELSFDWTEVNERNRNDTEPIQVSPR